MRAFVARQLHAYTVYFLALVPKTLDPRFIAHTTFQERLLSLFAVHEILEFDISFSKTPLLSRPGRNL